MQALLILFGFISLFVAVGLVVLGTSPFVCLPLTVGGLFGVITGCLED